MPVMFGLFMVILRSCRCVNVWFVRDNHDVHYSCVGNC